jgi:biotin synthase
MMPLEEVLVQAKRAVDNGATRICLAAAWRSPRPGKQFDHVLKMVEEITAMGVEVCCTLGSLKEEAAEQLKVAGMHSYNHNLDTSEEYYPQIITTRTYQERLDTLDVLDKVGLSVCCGGIIGLGESREDRLALLHTLATRSRHPDSVPINMLTAVKGTPLGNQPRISFWELLRMVAIARILMPRAMVRLSSGRAQLTDAEQGLCFLAGANSFHSGKKLLVTPTNDFDQDDQMMELFGLSKLEPFSSRKKQCGNGKDIV